MDSASLFRRVMATYGKTAVKPTGALLAFLREKGLSETAIDYVAEHVLNQAAGVSYLGFYSEAEMLTTNADDFLPIALRDGLLVVGSCPNGDPVAVDVRDQIGVTGYVDHESMWQVANVREVFQVIAPSLGKLAEAADEDRVPIDYFAALDENNRIPHHGQTKSRIQHPWFRRLQWNPFVAGTLLAIFVYRLIQADFPLTKSLGGIVVAIWFVMAVYDSLTSHRLLDAWYSDDET